MSALEPGLYKATVRGVADVTVFIDGAHLGRTADYVEDHREHRVRDQITDARPLIVLDIPSGRARYVIELLRQPAHSWANHVADQIEAQTKPARIPEPGLWGVVEAYTSASDALYSCTRPSTLVRTSGLWMEADTGSSWGWDELIDPTLIRDGVTS